MIKGFKIRKIKEPWIEIDGWVNTLQNKDNSTEIKGS